MAIRGACMALILLCAGAVAVAAEAEAEAIPPRRSLFVFVGPFNKGTFPGWSMIPYAAEMESNVLVGGAYDMRLMNLGPAFTFGAEVGAAGRFGDRGSAEFWGGGRFRHIGIPLGNFVTVTPAVTLGLSAVTDSIGIERARAAQNGGDATLLFYMAPEVALRFERLPRVEFVIRTHHRSGLKHVFGNMREGSNVNVFGVRIPF